MKLLLAFFPLICFILNIGIQISFVRFKGEGYLLKSVFLGFLCGFLTLVVGSISLSLPLYAPLDIAGRLLLGLLSYVAFGYGYFHFINLGETARRIRIVRELSKAKEGMTLDELLEHYNADEIMGRRFQRLLNKKQIVLINEKYYIGNPSMLWMTKIMLFLKKLLNLSNQDRPVERKKVMIGDSL